MITGSIVLYNTSESDIERVVLSYCPDLERRLYIIDNSPNETVYCTKLENENIIYIKNKQNLGYGKAHNVALKKAMEDGSKYHIVLNPDIQFEPRIIDELVRYADENEDVVYILPKTVYPDGELQYLCKLLPTPFDLIFRRFFPAIGPFKKMNERYVLKDSGYDKIINPPCLSGCFMFLRIKTLDEHKLFFDDKFFMYCEDFDFIRRLHRVGKTIFYPNVSIIHNHAKESYRSTKMLMLHIWSACLYFNKYGWFADKERKTMNDRCLKEIE